MFKRLEEFDQEISNFQIFANNFRDVGLLYFNWSLKISSIFLMAIYMFFTYKNVIILIIIFTSVYAVYVPIEIFTGIIYLVYRRIHYTTIKLR
jgi:hypothetical protein